MQDFRKSMIVAMVAACCVLTGAGGVFGQTPATPGKKALSTVTVILQKRTTMSVGRPLSTRVEPGNNAAYTPAILMTRAGLFAVVAETEIYNAADAAISLDALAVPCEAQIDYQRASSTARNAIVIHVRRPLPGAKKSWYVPEPE